MSIHEEYAKGFPVNVPRKDGGSVRVLCPDAVSGTVLRFIMEWRDAEALIERSCEQDLDITALEAADGSELATRAEQRLRVDDARYFGPGALLVPPFRPLSETDVAGADAYRLYDYLSAQAHRAGFENRFERLDVWPEVARTLYFLVIAHSQLAGKGFEVYLEQAPFQEIDGVLKALVRTGCTRLETRMRQAIRASAKQRSAEFLDQVDPKWVQKEGRPIPKGTGPVWPRIDSHDEGGTWWLVDHELAPTMAQFIETIRAGLCNP